MANIGNIDKIISSYQHEEEEKQFQALAKSYNIPYVYLVGYPVVKDILNIIPIDIARTEKVIAYLKSGQIIKIASPNPNSETLRKYLHQLKLSRGLNFQVHICSNSSLNYALNLYISLKKEEETAEAKNAQIKQMSKEQFSKDIKNLIDLKDKIKSIPATQLLDILFAGAVASGASDIHIEPQEKNMQIRFRIDGVLQPIAELPTQAYLVLRSRIKYLAGLKLDVQTKPQDGSFSTKAANTEIDIRVSTLPSAHGEEIVMRLLPKEGKFISLEQLGFRPEHIKIIREAIAKPNGIIFNTGPTGSGKTTTLYSILSELNKPGVKIITLEDPIEYQIQGIDQSQVDPSKGYDFATGLRSALRQDPDIIMVGEIRDPETASISVQAAMTGHLVLTTLHTNSAAGALPRLLDMGVKPYLLGGSINLIIAQRLVRRICTNCRGKGCELCNKTGYHGRIVIAELLVPNKEIEDLIQQKGSLRDFQETAKSLGMMTMLEDGLDKVKLGLTTEEEVRRVTKE